MLKKILVVDDEEDIIDLIRYNLEKEGYSVATASDGDSALQVAGEFKPDLIILDIMMPGPDGFEVCRQVRLIPG
ncbi:MAG: response regulator, partial [bacterium]